MGLHGKRYLTSKQKESACSKLCYQKQAIIIFFIMLSDDVLQKIPKCSILDSHRATGNTNMNVMLDLTSIMGFLCWRCVTAKRPALLAFRIGFRGDKC